MSTWNPKELVGTRLGGFEILELVGRGGMGAVYKARQVSLDRIVAVKILDPAAIDSESDIEAFHKEAQIVAQLKHPGIVQVYEAGEADGLHFFVMEFVSGQSVAASLSGGSCVSESDALRVGLSVAAAMGFAWTKTRSIHCDLKPGNLLLDEDGAVKVTDFGLAGLLRNDPADDDYVACTPHYSAPEQVLGEPMDCRSDIYSFGATLYHMLTGTIPFGDLPGDSVPEQQVSGVLPDPRELNGEISPYMVMLLRKMMAKSPGDRPATWADVASDLKRVSKRKALARPLDAAVPSTVPRRQGDGVAVVRPELKTGLGGGPVRSSMMRGGRRLGAGGGRGFGVGLLVALAVVVGLVVVVLVLSGSGRRGAGPGSTGKSGGAAAAGAGVKVVAGSVLSDTLGDVAGAGLGLAGSCLDIVRVSVDRKNVNAVLITIVVAAELDRGVADGFEVVLSEAKGPGGGIIVRVPVVGKAGDTLEVSSSGSEVHAQLVKIDGRIVTVRAWGTIFEGRVAKGFVRSVGVAGGVSGDQAPDRGVAEFGL